MTRGRLIVFEGIDGSGKSTQVARLRDVLGAAGHAVVATREPSDGPHGRRIRELSREGRTLAPEQELDLFLRDREDHVVRVIAPALEAGRVVVSDRYFLSTAAYQGARGLDARAILADCEAKFPLPDLALLLELPVETGLARADARGAGRDGVFERPDFLRRVAWAFAGFERPYLVRLDATRDADTVYADVRSALRARLALP